MTKNNPRPTTPYPLNARPGVLHTSELVPGDTLWTTSGVWEVESVTHGGHAGWRHVRFAGNPTPASVVHSHPWIVASPCEEDGCDRWSLEDGEVIFCEEHQGA